MTLAVVAGTGLGLLLRHPPRGLPAALGGAGVDAVLAPVAQAAAWGLLCWCCAAVTLSALAGCPGRAGRLAAAVARRLAPRLVRRAVAAALGVALTAAAPAAAAGPDPARCPAGPPPSLDWPTATATPEVVVRAGDSLWAIAARHLPAGAADAAVATAWPRWYLANRDVIGADPDLLQPGQRLHPPPNREQP